MDTKQQQQQKYKVTNTTMLSGYIISSSTLKNELHYDTIKEESLNKTRDKNKTNKPSLKRKRSWDDTSNLHDKKKSSCDNNNHNEGLDNNNIKNINKNVNTTTTSSNNISNDNNNSTTNTNNKDMINSYGYFFKPSSSSASVLQTILQNNNIMIENVEALVKAILIVLPTHLYKILFDAIQYTLPIQLTNYTIIYYNNIIKSDDNNNTNNDIFIEIHNNGIQLQPQTTSSPTSKYILQKQKKEYERKSLATNNKVWNMYEFLKNQKKVNHKKKIHLHLLKVMSTSPIIYVPKTSKQEQKNNDDSFILITLSYTKDDSIYYINAVCKCLQYDISMIIQPYDIISLYNVYRYKWHVRKSLLKRYHDTYDNYNELIIPDYVIVIPNINCIYFEKYNNIFGNKINKFVNDKDNDDNNYDNNDDDDDDDVINIIQGKIIKIYNTLHCYEIQCSCKEKRKILLNLLYYPLNPSIVGGLRENTIIRAMNIMEYNNNAADIVLKNDDWNKNYYKLYYATLRSTITIIQVASDDTTNTDTTSNHNHSKNSIQKINLYNSYKLKNNVIELSFFNSKNKTTNEIINQKPFDAFWIYWYTKYWFKKYSGLYQTNNNNNDPQGNMNVNSSKLINNIFQSFLYYRSNNQKRNQFSRDPYEEYFIPYNTFKNNGNNDYPIILSLHKIRHAVFDNNYIYNKLKYYICLTKTKNIIGQGWIFSDYLDCYDLYSLIYNDKIKDDKHDNNKKNSLVICTVGYIQNHITTTALKKENNNDNISITNMYCTLPITTSKHYDTNCKKNKSSSIKYLSNNMVTIPIQSTIISCVCISTTFNNNNESMDSNNKNVSIIPNEKGNTCIIPIQNYLFAISIQLQCQCSCCVCCAAACYNNNNCQNDHESDHCDNDNNCDFENNNNYNHDCDNDIDIDGNNNNDNSNLHSIQSFLAGNISSATTTKTSTTTPKTKTKTAITTVIKENNNDHLNEFYGSSITNNTNTTIHNQKQKQYLIGRYVRRRINFNTNNNNNYYNKEKNVYNGITLTISHIPTSQHTKIKSWNDICTIQSINIQLSISLSKQYITDITKIFQQYQFYNDNDNNNNDNVKELIHFLVAWCHITENLNTCALVTGSFDDYWCNNIKNKHDIFIKIPLSNLISSKITKSNRCYWKCSLDCIQSYFICNDYKSSTTTTGTEANDNNNTSNMQSFHVIGGMRNNHLLGYLDQWPIRRKKQQKQKFNNNTNISISQHGPLLYFPKNELLSGISKCTISQLLIENVTRQQQKSNTNSSNHHHSPYAVRNIPSCRLLCILFCRVQAQCMICFRSLVHKQPRNNNDKLYCPMHPNNNSQNYKIKWECSGIIDDNTGQSKLYSDYDTSLLLLNSNHNGTNNILSSNEISIIENAAWINENGILFHHLYPPTNTSNSGKNQLSSSIDKAKYSLYKHCRYFKKYPSLINILVRPIGTSSSSSSSSSTSQDYLDIIRNKTEIEITEDNIIPSSCSYNNNDNNTATTTTIYTSTRRRSVATFTLPILKLNLIDCYIDVQKGWDLVNELMQSSDSDDDDNDEEE